MSVQRRNTRQRKLIYDAVRARNDHPTADDIYLDVRAIDEHVSRGTVYRNLNLLAETGEIIAIKAPGCSRFDWRNGPHAHIVCESCGCVQDAIMSYDEKLDRLAIEQTGFARVSHTTLFQGLCADCAKAE